MNNSFSELLAQHELLPFESILRSFTEPTIGFSLVQPNAKTVKSTSKFGGIPHLPRDLSWPAHKGRPLDFLMQLNMADLRSFDVARSLPRNGVLTFLYDLEDQPWGFDPANLIGYRVLFSPDLTELSTHQIPNAEFALAERKLEFYPMLTLPHIGSRAADQLFSTAKLNDDQQDGYSEFVGEFEGSFAPNETSPVHQLFGHSANIQNDMQIEAQLVTNGLNCGDGSGYQDPRAKMLESGADDWKLLLQLDSDDAANIMWGDCGRLYFWIRKQDLAELRFEKVWMTLQCY